MKKIMSIQILFILVLFISMGCGCEKDPIEPDYPMEITTAADLDGTWEFVNLYYPGVTRTNFTTCDDIAETARTDGKSLLLSFIFTSSTEAVTVTDKCFETGMVDYIYNMVGNNTIEIRPDPYTGPRTYSIVSYNNTTGVLVLDIPVPNSSDRPQLTLQKI